ncbi:ABC transporter ATP-binding protein [Bradyrhizobium sp.]|jgi:branched-chain amino acid transport system ATP-binding protein|uniref:ABC transporter ATP-binding protein n=1 Tax=Bradyrhizobium sp. TaxID=376 RepID=UPI003C24EF33
MLRVSSLQAGYGDSQVLFDVNFEVGSGEVVTLMGRNGMGKTTTINTIFGIVQARAGEVSFDGKSIKGLAPFRVAQHGLGLVPEGRQIFPNLTVRENLVATASNRMSNDNPWTLELIFDLFPTLRGRSNAMALLLSGGEQQMLAIGRALMTNPRLIVLDEATEGLAPLIRVEIWKCLERLKSAGYSILITDKNVKALTRIASRHYFLEKGRIVHCCDSATLRRDVELQHKYLGI